MFKNLIANHKVCFNKFPRPTRRHVDDLDSVFGDWIDVLDDGIEASDSTEEGNDGSCDDHEASLAAVTGLEGIAY